VVETGCVEAEVVVLPGGSLEPEVAKGHQPSAGARWRGLEGPVHLVAIYWKGRVRFNLAIWSDNGSVFPKKACKVGT
jgi:hypothetical protein